MTLSRVFKLSFLVYVFDFLFIILQGLLFSDTDTQRADWTFGNSMLTLFYVFILSIGSFGFPIVIATVGHLTLKRFNIFKTRHQTLMTDILLLEVFIFLSLIIWTLADTFLFYNTLALDKFIFRFKKEFLNFTGIAILTGILIPIFDKKIKLYKFNSQKK
ncbi:MAG: hypothetical protein ACT4OJ_05300 [Bacteroidota bacterium]